MLVARIDVARTDRRGATEKNVQRIPFVEGDEALGYSGRGREEHSGEPATDRRRAKRPTRTR